MKQFYVLLVALSVAFSSCNSSAQSNDFYFPAEQYDYTVFSGKTVQSMKYCDGCGQSGDYLIITFTDGVTIKVWAYKYNMRIY